MLVRLLAPLLGVIVFIAAAVLFSFLFLIGAAAALGLWGWLAWKTRHLRRAGGGAAPQREPEGHVIEGEYRVEERPGMRDAISEPEAPPRNKDGPP